MELKRTTISPFKFQLFLALKLPIALFARTKLISQKPNSCTISIKHSWFNQNPFRSMYVGALLTGAELSTGLLLFQYLNQDFNFSMLLVNQSSKYFKKATGKIRFICKPNENIESWLKTTMDMENGNEIALNTVALNSKNEEVASFTFNWSVKRRVQR